MDTTIEAVTVPTRKSGLRALPRMVVGTIWRARGLWLGLIAVGCGLYGQKLLVDYGLYGGGVQEENIARTLLFSIRWYTVGIILMILAWLGTYKNKNSLLPPNLFRALSTLSAPHATPTSEPAHGRLKRILRKLSTMPARLRYGLALAALALNLFSVSQLRGDYYSVVGSLGWVASLLLLVLAFVGHRPKTDPGVAESVAAQDQDVEDTTDIAIPRKLEIAIIFAIFALGLGLRLYRLDDWSFLGLTGDEGVPGLSALSIIEGQRVSPFEEGWAALSNFSYWTIALTMQVFGTGMLGLKMFNVLTGSLMIFPFYLLVRMWFGVRAAIIAGFLLTVSAVSIHFNRSALMNETAIICLVTGFYFLFRGLRDRRTTDFVLSAYFHLTSLYFYYSARVTPFLLLAVFAYLFLLIPLLRLPGVYAQIHKLMPDHSRLTSLRQAAGVQVRSVYQYLGQIFVFVIACICIASPWTVYYIDHTAGQEGHVNEKLIFNNESLMADQYSETHNPLYIGLRAPRPDDVYPVSPLVFERTPTSVMLSTDGFWPRVLWKQTVTTLSMLTYRPDASGFYDFSIGAVTKPVEAVFVVFGIAFALWRWRDTRMGVLSMWFWSAILTGGALTINQPYYARMAGIFPTLAIFAAIILNKLVAEFVGAASRFRFRPNLSRRVAQALSGVAVVLLLGYLAVQNYEDYFIRFPALKPSRNGMGQAIFVRDMNNKVRSEGRPTPKYYDLASEIAFWTYETNSFLNYGTPGEDLMNPSEQIAHIKNEGRDVVFMVGLSNLQFLPEIRSRFPGGEQDTFYYGPHPNLEDNKLFVYYRVKQEQMPP